jgi:hypothetical protein
MPRYSATRISTGSAGAMGRHAVWDSRELTVVSYHRTHAKAEAIAADLNRKDRSRNA